MGASRDDIERWLGNAKRRGATHLIVACDTFSYDHYPVLVMPGEDVLKKEAETLKGGMTTVEEIYNLSMDIQAQLGQRRCRNL